MQVCSTDLPPALGVGRGSYVYRQLQDREVQKHKKEKGNNYELCFCFKIHHLIRGWGRTLDLSSSEIPEFSQKNICFGMGYI